MDLRKQHDHHLVTPQPSALRRLRKAAGWCTLISAVLLVGLYVWDYLTLRRQLQNAWCVERFGYPEQFSYLLPNTAERIGAGITDWWGWYPPGMTCQFTDVLTKQSVTIGPEMSRGYAAIALLVCLMVFATAYFYLRIRTRRSR